MTGGKGYTRHQQGIIKRHYETADARSIQRLQELVSEIYLCDSEKKADRLWERVRQCLGQIKARPEFIDSITTQRDVAQLAKLVGDAAGKK